MKLGLLLFSFLIPVTGIAQENTNASNDLSIQYGLDLIHRQDLLFSPMVYHDLSFKNASLQYSNENIRRWHIASITFALYKARWHDDYEYLSGFEVTTYTTAPTSITLVGVRYCFLEKIKLTEHGSWSAGGLADNQINSVDNLYGGFGTFGYLGQFSLSPAARKQLLIGEKQELLLTVYFPLISWVSRSPYALNDDEYMHNNADHNGFKTLLRYIGDGKIQTVNRLQKLNLDVEYNYQWAKRWQVGGIYRMEYLRNTKPKTLTAFRNDLHLKITFKF